MANPSKEHVGQRIEYEGNRATVVGWLEDDALIQYDDKSFGFQYSDIKAYAGAKKGGTGYDWVHVSEEYTLLDEPVEIDADTPLELLDTCYEPVHIPQLLLTTAQIKKYFEETTKPSLMTNILKKVKDLALSKTDRTLRAHGFEDENGKMTSVAMDYVDTILQEERWAEVREQLAKDIQKVEKDEA